MVIRFLIALICPPLSLILMHRPVQAAIDAAFWIGGLWLSIRWGWMFTGATVYILAFLYPLILHAELRMERRMAHAHAAYKGGYLVHPK